MPRREKNRPSVHPLKISGIGTPSGSDSRKMPASVPNKNIKKWKRTILVSNDNFETDKWKYGKFRKYGLNLRTDHTFRFNNDISGHLAAIIMAGDIGIDLEEFRQKYTID